MEKEELITLVNNVELIDEIKEILQRNNIWYEDKCEFQERYVRATRGARWTKKIDYIITIFVKTEDIEKAMNIKEITDIIYGHDQDLIDNVSKEMNNDSDKIFNDNIANAEDDEEEGEDKYTKRINLTFNIMTGVLFVILGLALIAVIL